MLHKAKILLTRPLRDSEELCDLLQRKGYSCRITPLLKICRTKYVMPECFSPDIILITSKNAVRFFDFNLPKLENASVVVLGKKTGQFLKMKTKKKVTFIDGDEKQLLKKNHAHLIPEGCKVLHPTSQIKNLYLANFLLKIKCQYLPIICYKSHKENEFESQFINFMKNEDGLITIFSSRTAESLLKEIAKLNLREFCSKKKVLVLSHKIANKLKKLSFSEFFISKEPNLLSMIKEIDSIFKKRELF